jgi:hypothetical protein
VTNSIRYRQSGSAFSQFFQFHKKSVSLRPLCRRL